MTVCYICRSIGTQVKHITKTNERFAVSSVETVVSIKYERHIETILVFELGLSVLCCSLRLINLIVDDVYKGVITYQFAYAVAYSVSVLSMAYFLLLGSENNAATGRTGTHKKAVHKEILFLESLLFVLILWFFSFVGNHETGRLKELSYSISVVFGLISGISSVSVLC